MPKLSNAVKKDVVKNTEYNKLVTKVDNIDTTGFVLKTKFDTDQSDLEKKISDVGKNVPDTSAFIKKPDCSSKITEIENKIPSINGLATNSALTAVENKIPNVSNLVKEQTIAQTLVKLEVKLIITIMKNILLLQSLII